MMRRLDIIKTFADHVELERNRLGISQKNMADRMEVSLSTYKRMISYENDKIDLYLAYKLNKLTGKSIGELIGAKEKYFDLNEKLDALSDYQLAYVEGLIDFEKAFGENNKDVDEFVTVYIPTGNMEDGMIYDSSNVEKINVAPYRSHYGVFISCGIRVTSNHLHPVYNRNDILLIAKCPMRDGDTGVFLNRENGCAYIRKYHQTTPCKLEPINDYGQTFFVDGDDKEDMARWIKFGRVVAKVR